MEVNDFTEKEKMAEDLAQELYNWMSNLKGVWNVHENSFLPANVCCDYAGMRGFINGMREIILKNGGFFLDKRSQKV